MNNYCFLHSLRAIKYDRLVVRYVLYVMAVLYVLIVCIGSFMWLSVSFGFIKDWFIIIMTLASKRWDEHFLTLGCYVSSSVILEISLLINALCL